VTPARRISRTKSSSVVRRAEKAFSGSSIATRTLMAIPYGGNGAGAVTHVVRTVPPAMTFFCGETTFRRVLESLDRCVWNSCGPQRPSPTSPVSGKKHGNAKEGPR
jgi:hypothetical protein